MTFTQLNRGPTIKLKMPKPGDREVALKWWANPTAPFLGISLGATIAWSLGIRHLTDRVDVLIGEGEDAGKIRIKQSENGSWLCRVRGGEYCVFLTSEVSLARFAMFPGAKIQSCGIEFRDRQVTFPIPTAAQLVSGGTHVG